MQNKVEKQEEYINKVRAINSGKNLKYVILTMGCQLNENDSEKIAGMLENMGYEKTEKLEDADFIAFNTCCVRENAEDRLFGKLGEVKKYVRDDGKIKVSRSVKDLSIKINMVRKEYLKKRKRNYNRGACKNFTCYKRRNSISNRCNCKQCGNFYK